MKWLLPLLGVLGAALLLLSGEPAPPAGPPPWSEPPVTRRPGTLSAAQPPPARAEPNLAGEVIDGEGRLVPGAEVTVSLAGGEPVARTATDETGTFALRVEAEPPLSARAEPEGEAVTVTGLPRLDLELGLPRAEFGVDEMIVRPVGGDPPEEAAAEVLVRDGLGRTALRIRRRFSHAPWVLGPLPHGTYGVVVRAGALAGAVPAFAFGTQTREVAVNLSAAAALRAKLPRPARAILLATGAALAPLSRATREEDGLAAVVRGAIARLDLAGEIWWTGIPAGSYRLRILGEGVEVLELAVELAPGETRDLGTIELAAAGASLTIDLDEGGPRRNGYVVHLYTPAGLCLRRVAEPGTRDPVRFEGLSSGEWYFRVGRMVGGPDHTQAVGWHRRVDLAPGEARAVREDCTWCFD
jgi:hypothetical protein